MEKQMINRTTEFNELLQKFKIENFDESKNSDLMELYSLSKNEIKRNNGDLGLIPPFELHPYIGDISNDLNHKAIMIGTFPPITYLADQLNISGLTILGEKARGNSRPLIPYFHGNIGALWDYCPIEFKSIARGKDRNEIKNKLIEKLNECNIVYSDIIKFCRRKINYTKGGKLKYSSSDADLIDIVPNFQILDFLMNSGNVDRLYFTNSYAFGMGRKLFQKSGEFELVKNDSFQLFLKAAQLRKLKVEIRIPNFQNDWMKICDSKTLNKDEIKKLNELMTTKALLYLRISNSSEIKEFKVVSSVSPSAVEGNRTRSVLNPCVIKFSKDYNCKISDAPRELLKKTLSSFFINDLDWLENINC